MSWQVIPTDNAVHVVPVRDIERHVLKQNCKCLPRTESAPSGGLIIIHDAFDGRLGIEWANEILNNG